MIRVRTTNQPTNQTTNNQQPWQIPSLHSFLQRHFGFAPLRPLAISGTRPETSSKQKPPENGWLRDDPFILGPVWPFFWGTFAVTNTLHYIEPCPKQWENQWMAKVPLQGVSFAKEIHRHNTTRRGIWNPTVTPLGVALSSTISISSLSQIFRLRKTMSFEKKTSNLFLQGFHNEISSTRNKHTKEISNRSWI